MPKVSKIAGPLRVQSLLTFCDLCARDRYIPKIRENRDSSENCEIPRNVRDREIVTAEEIARTAIVSRPTGVNPTYYVRDCA
jgi:hypothetical protein